MLALRVRLCGGAGERLMAEDALPGTGRANTHSERFRDAMTQTRTRTDLTAKAIAAIGTGAITAIGYAKLADLFPYGGPTIAVVGLFAGVLAMILAVGLLVRRFFRASQVVITHPDWRKAVESNELDREETRVLKDAYEDAARAGDVDSLIELEERGRKFEEDARKLEAGTPSDADVKRAKVGHKQAEQIFAELQAAQDRGAAFIVRRRSTYALFGLRTLLPLALFVLGWYWTALGSDALESHRKDKIDVAVSCADAREKAKIVKGELPSICGTEEKAKDTTQDSDKPKGNPSKITSAAIAALVDARAQCLRAAEKAGRSRRVCRPLTQSLRASQARSFPPSP